MFAISTALSAARAQQSTVLGRVVARESGHPVANASVSVLPNGTQHLAGEDGSFTLRDLHAGEVRLRFRRIGFAPKDTVLLVAVGDTVRLRIEMNRLALELPAVVASTCTDRTPFEDKPPILAALYDQVIQNAERLRLLARERPFTIQITNTRGLEGRTAMITDTVVRGPLPEQPYAPKHILRDFQGRKSGGVMMPQLTDIADTAFTNNHCLWYAGQQRFGADSVVRVDFEPVPWLAREVDFAGSIYVRVDGYALVGMETRLNRMPGEWSRTVVGYGTRSHFQELVGGVPVIADWEITNTFRGSSTPTVNQRSRVIAVEWSVPPTTARDTVRRPPR